MRGPLSSRVTMFLVMVMWMVGWMLLGVSNGTVKMVQGSYAACLPGDASCRSSPTFSFKNTNYCCPYGATVLLNNQPSCLGGQTEGCQGASLTNGGWSEWSVCSATCGGGTQTRFCIRETYGGTACTGATMQACGTTSCSYLNSILMGPWAGTKPACPAFCVGCQLQPGILVGTTVVVKELACTATQTASVRTLNYAPWCPSSGECSDVSVAIAFQDPLVTGTSVSASTWDNCFHQVGTAVVTAGSGSDESSMRQARMTVSCVSSPSGVCTYALAADIFCQEYLPGHTASAIASDGSSLLYHTTNPMCSTMCVNCNFIINVAGGSYFSVTTGSCNIPSITSFAVQARDSTSLFRVYTTTSASLAAGTTHYPIGSSTQLTGEPVSCYSMDFHTGDLALIGQTGSLYIMVVCMSPSCQFKYRYSIACSSDTASRISYVATSSMDACQNACGHFGTCYGGTCVCDSGYTGIRCNTPPYTPVVATIAPPMAGGWSNWTACVCNAVGSGSGSGTQTRTCDNPPPRNGGATCSGSSTQICTAGCNAVTPTPSPTPTPSSSGAVCSCTCCSGYGCTMSFVGYTPISAPCDSTNSNQQCISQCGSSFPGKCSSASSPALTLVTAGCSTHVDTIFGQHAFDENTGSGMITSWTSLPACPAADDSTLQPTSVSFSDASCLSIGDGTSARITSCTPEGFAITTYSGESCTGSANDNAGASEQCMSSEHASYIVRCNSGHRSTKPLVYSTLVAVFLFLSILARYC